MREPGSSRRAPPQAPCRVLLVEDHAPDARLIRAYLDEAPGLPCEVTVAMSLAEAHRYLAEPSFDVVLLDLTLPDSSAVETVARLDAIGAALPLLVLTGLEDEAIGVQAVQAGAQDYLVKGQLDGPLLGRAVRHARERHRAQRRLTVLAELGRLLSATLHRREIVHAVARGAARLMDAEVVSVWTRSHDRRSFVLGALFDSGDRPGFPTLDVPHGQGAIGRAARTREIVEVPDVRSKPGLIGGAWASRHGLEGALLLPVRAEDGVVAIVGLWSREPIGLGPSERALLEGFAAQSAIALRNARLFEENVALREHDRALFERNLAGIFVSAPDGTVLDANDAFARLLGRQKASEIIGRDAHTFYVDPGERDRLIDRLWRDGIVGNMELSWRRLDGSVLRVLATARLVQDTGTPQFEGFAIDITDRQLAEVATREAEALRRVAQLANAAAHEINNPLTVISSRLDLLDREVARGDATRRHVTPALRACERIRDIVRRMGQITRLEVDDTSPSLPAMLDLRRSAPVEGDVEVAPPRPSSDQAC